MTDYAKTLIGLFIIACALNPASACDYCIASQGISPVELGSSGVRYDLRYLHLCLLFKDGVKVSNPLGLEETYITHQLSFHYRFGEALTFSVLLPFASKSTLAVGPNDDGDHIVPGMQTPQHIEMRADKTQGIGDLILLGKYRLLDENSAADDPFTLVVTGGLKCATGKSDIKANNGAFLDPHMQLGTGSTDLIAGVSAVKGIEDFSFVLSLTGIIPSEGANGYKFGPNVNYDLGARYRFLEGEDVSGSLFGALSVVGEWRGKESQDGVKLDDTGGNTTYISPGAVYFITKRISVEASYQYPFLHRLNGTQLGESYRLVAGAQYLF